MRSKILSLFLLSISIYFQSIICLHFDFSQSPARCYIEEFLHNSHVGISYKIWSRDSKRSLDYGNILFNLICLVNTQILPRIEIKIITEENQVIYSSKLKSDHNKFSYINDKEGFYMICAEYSGGWHPDGEILMSLNFIHENQDEPNIMDALKLTHLDPIKTQLIEIIHRGKLIVKSQEEELHLEDSNAKNQMAIVSFFYNLTIYQVFAFILLGVYQAYEFRKILNK